MAEEILPRIGFDEETGQVVMTHVKRTRWERFIEWLIPAPYAAEEREAIKAYTHLLEVEAREIEFRLKQEKEKRELEKLKNSNKRQRSKGNYILKASKNFPVIWGKNSSNTKKDGFVIVDLEENTKTKDRRYTIRSVRRSDFEIIETHYEHANAFVLTTVDYTKVIRPWVERTIDTRDIEKLANNWTMA